jgi:DNA repair protein RecO (recombination protein O)
MAAGFASSKNRVEAAPAWLLHSYPYKETSLVIEVLSRDFGRLAMVARGARRPMSTLRGSLLAFQPLSLSWFGASELRTLHGAEWQGGVPQLTGLPLICGFYLNELLLKLTAREDPHTQLFAVYDEAVRELARPGVEVEPILRRFELGLLQELGYGFALDRDAEGNIIDGVSSYQFVPGRGLLPSRDLPTQVGVSMDGKVLQQMAQGQYRDPHTAQQAKALMRALLADLLGNAPLHTRKLLRDLHKL